MRISGSRPARPTSWRLRRAQEARLRKAVLSLARETEFGKRMINGGRLSVPSVYDTPLSTADVEIGGAGLVRGLRCSDAPIATRDGRSTFLTETFIERGKEVYLARIRQWR